MRPNNRSLTLKGQDVQVRWCYFSLFVIHDWLIKRICLTIRNSGNIHLAGSDPSKYLFLPIVLSEIEV